MIKVLSWNIQCGLGVDGLVDLSRIAAIIREMADFDVVCLQEVSRCDGFLTFDNPPQDQAEILAKHFMGYTACFGPAVDRLNADNLRRSQFGNMILSRLPVLQIFNHQLPQPLPETFCKHMPRQALEVVVASQEGPIRVTTTHLEYHSQRQRLAQAKMLSQIQSDIISVKDYADYAPTTGAYAPIPRPVSGILCGDFNSAPFDQVYQVIHSGDETIGAYKDAWRLARGDEVHAPTCGIFDHQQWPEGPHCRDLFFVSGGLKERLIDILIQSNTDASDHQPIMMTVI